MMWREGGAALLKYSVYVQNFSVNLI